jgi:hypothetical protein
MPRGYPGTGPSAGRRRQVHEAARRAGALSKAEKNVIEALAADQPSAASEAALEQQIDRVARVLRRSPAAVKAQLDRARAKMQARAVAYADLHFQAATIAAARGDSRPAEFGLERLKVVEPIEKASGGCGMVVNVIPLPGLPGYEPIR